MSDSKCPPVFMSECVCLTVMQSVAAGCSALIWINSCGLLCRGTLQTATHTNKMPLVQWGQIDLESCNLGFELKLHFS